MIARITIILCAVLFMQGCNSPCYLPVSTDEPLTTEANSEDAPSRNAVYFKPASYIPSIEEEKIIISNSNFFRYKNNNICIYGYADRKGSKKFNQRLSEKRADAVTELLVSNGIEQKRIISKGFGESILRYNGNEINKFYINRRVDILEECTTK